MKINLFSLHFWIRLISLCCFFVPIAVSRIRTGRPPTHEALFFPLMAASSVMIMLPVANENIRLSFVFAVLVLAASACFALMDFPCMLYVTVCLLLILIHQALRLILRYSMLRSLFQPQAVWYSLESHLRLLLSFGDVLLALFVVAVPRQQVVRYLVFAVLLSWYLLLYYRSLSGRCLLLSRRRERIVKRMICCSADISDRVLSGEDAEDSEKAKNLYEKLTRIMVSRRPFLNPDYSLQDLADTAYTNKTYISRTINTVSGKNFRQFVNGYRVQYAVELLEDNPRLTVSELAEKSGFHSSVTFTMAFKLNMGATPGEYTIRLRSGLVSPLSSRREQAPRREQPSSGLDG